MKTEWQKEMQRKAADYRVTPPEGVWPELERRMVTEAQRQRRRTASIRYRRLAVAASVAVIATLSLYIYDASDNRPTPTRPQQLSAQQDTDGNTPRHLDGTADAGSPAMTAMLHAKAGNDSPGAAQGMAAATEDETVTAADATATDAEEHAGSVAEEGSLPTKGNSLSTGNNSLSSEDAPVPTKENITARSMNAKRQADTARKLAALGAVSTRKSRLTARIGATSAMVGYGNASMAGPMLAMADPIGGYSDIMDGSKSEVILNSTSPTVTDIRHHQPLKLNASVRYALNGRWSIESGLTYSYLSSEITRRNESCTIESEQRLHYVGIPLNISYSLWRNKRLNVYVSGGGEVQKMVGGNSDTRTVMAGNVDKGNSEKVNMKQLQLSVSGAMGAEFLLSGNMGVFFEPGITYHFDNGSDIPTVYKDRPFNLSLSLGLRLNVK